MSEPGKEEFRKLVERYLDGSATFEERRALESYYTLFDSAPDTSGMFTEDQLEALGDRMKERISGRLRPAAPPFYRRAYFRAAAVIAILLGAIWLLPTHSPTHRKTPNAIATTRTSLADLPVNRFMTLPDGSTVILHGDSKLEIDENFNQSERVVRLTGEAYFDVAHRPDTPFIIHTGKIKTTVLGTAFNITAWPGQQDITVSVTRGKVRVEDENRVIAVLTPDKQVTYNKMSSTSGEKLVEATETIAWLQQDMTFDEMALEELADHLGRRYGVNITFGNPELQTCSVTGRFTGTETLEEVMRTLSILMNTQYTISGKEVLIEGEKNCS